MFSLFPMMLLSALMVILMLLKPFDRISKRWLSCYGLFSYRDYMASQMPTLLLSLALSSRVLLFWASYCPACYNDLCSCHSDVSFKKLRIFWRNEERRRVKNVGWRNTEKKSSSHEILYSITRCMNNSFGS